MPSSTGLKKNYQFLTPADRKKLIEKNNKKITIKRQCELLDISRAGAYYEPIDISEEDKNIMDLIDGIYTARPFYGQRRIRAELNFAHQIAIGRDHIRTLMRMMGIEAIYPKKKNLSWPNKYHKIYPYLLRNLEIKYPNQVWSTDITYVKLEKGFAYLIAIIDWFSRYAINWKLSNCLEIDFCLECLKDAIARNKNKPEIFNSDQGSNFTSAQFTKILEANNIQISMDGRGRCLDNIFVERLWRTVKQENIYLNSYQNVTETRTGLNEYFLFYNNERRHQSLNYRTPQEIYFQTI